MGRALVKNQFYMFAYMGVLTLLVPHQAIAAALYEVYGPRGTVTFTSRTPPKGAKYRKLSTKKYGRSRLFSKGVPLRVRRSQYDRLIHSEATRSGLQPALVKAVVHAESSFNARAVSPKGAMGLMQLMPATAKRFGVRNAFSPDQNIRGGVKYLSWLFERYRGNLSLTLAAYNAGERAVDRHGNVPPYKETVRYVKKVKKLFALYQREHS